MLRKKLFILSINVFQLEYFISPHFTFSFGMWHKVLQVIHLKFSFHYKDYGFPPNKNYYESYKVSVSK